MSFKTIRKNKILAKISEFTVSSGTRGMKFGLGQSGMIRKYHNHILQTNPQHREK